MAPAEPKIMYLNPTFKRWHLLKHLSLEQILTSVITHEDLHGILYKLEGRKACDALDTLAGTITESQFFLDGDWKWIRKLS